MNAEAARKETPMSEPSTADGPYGGRQPTGHEQRYGSPWDASYHHGPAPWDIGEPQPSVVRLVAERPFAGPMLDAGCGTGENALHVAASLGVPVLGVDVAETAVAMARAKATERGVDAEFVVGDAFDLKPVGSGFRTVLDCGLFHTFDDDERPLYVASLAVVTEPGGILYLLCFRENPSGIGPRPLSQDEIRAAFRPDAGWDVASIEPEQFQTRIHEGGAPAWLATIRRI